LIARFLLDDQIAPLPITWYQVRTGTLLYCTWYDNDTQQTTTLFTVVAVVVVVVVAVAVAFVFMQ
jgi:hypothetical protein